MDLHQWIAADLTALRTRLFDGVLARVPAQRWDERAGGGSSVHHLVLHLARHQDLAVATAIRNRPPLFAEYAVPLGLAGSGSDVGLSERERPEVTAGIHSEALVAYTQAVFEATASWLARVGTLALDTVPDVARRFDQHAALDPDVVGWLYTMWQAKPVWWLIQWPVIGHGNNHAGEATGLRNRLGYSPL